MPEIPRSERTQLSDWPVPKASDLAEDFSEDEDYTAPVKANDAAMIQFLAARAKKS